jgi:hypothetical protein
MTQVATLTGHTCRVLLKSVPETQRLVASASDNRLTVRTHSKVKNTTGTGWEECLREYEPVTGAELEREGRWGSIWAIVSYASFDIS